MSNLIVVSGNFKWPREIRGVPVVKAREYMTNPAYSKSRFRIFNLCHTYKYQGVGYYVSLLAEARGHSVLPNVKTITNLQSASVSRLAVTDLEDMWDKLLEPIKSDQFELTIFFGRNYAKKYDRLCTALFNLFPSPLLKVNFQKTRSKWYLKNVSPMSVRHVSEENMPYVFDFADMYFKKQYRVHVKKKTRFDLAVLINEHEKEPPSDHEALEKFSRAASRIGIGVEYIGKYDYARIPQYDGLFIRETTAVNHHTYRFAQRADFEGLAVIDDPVSIIRCTNKVYLAELLKRKGVPIPATTIISKENINELASTFHFPVILKQPDSSFSQGVSKAENPEELLVKSRDLFTKSDLLIVQDFMPSEYDWRIGLIDGEPLFACKYYMASKHWQIMNWSKDDKTRYGNSSVLPLEKVPPLVIETAIKACSGIGDSFYGVDLKMINEKCYVIEVNDNPSLTAGIEDRVYGKQVYDRIAASFLRRMEGLR